MKRKDFRNRVRAFPLSFVRPMGDRPPYPAEDGSIKRERHSQIRKIFVIRQVRPSPRNTAGQGVRRILVFDNHPESLRLVFGRQTNPHVDLSDLHRTSIWALVLISVLTFAAVVGMFWPVL